MAVFTPVSLDEAKAYLQAYDIGDLISFEGISEGVSNTNFRVETTHGLYALTLFEAVTPKEDLPYFMNLTHHLDQKGFLAPGPVVKKDGEILGVLNHKPCALIKWLDGQWPRSQTPLHAYNAAAALAQMQILCKDFNETRVNSMGLDVWPQLILRCEEKAKNAQKGMEILREFKDFLPKLQNSWPHDLEKGTIHADYFIDNVLMADDGRLTGVIDYYYACTDLLVYDLVIGLTAWGFDAEGEHRLDIFTAFLKGYESIRPLDAREKAHLKLLGMAASMRFTLTRLYDLLNHDPKWLVKPKNPDAFFQRYLWWKAL